MFSVQMFKEVWEDNGLMKLVETW